MDQIPPTAGLRGRATLLRGQILYAEAQTLSAKPGATAEDRRDARRKFDAAIEAFRLAQSRDTVSNQATRQAMYLTGLCLRDLGDRRGAAAQLDRTAKLFAEYPEGLAATLEEAELSRQAKRDADALAAYRRVLGAITDPERFHNPWLPLDQLRTLALRLSRLFGRAELPDGLATEPHVLSAHAAGPGLGADGRGPHPLGPGALGRGRARAAGEGRLVRPPGPRAMAAGGRRLAAAGPIGTDRPPISRAALDAAPTPTSRGRITATRPDSCGTTSRTRCDRRHPQALLTLGQALLAMGDAEKALAAFEECVLDHPRDAAAYRARLLSAGIHAEKGQYQQAEALLQENLGGEHLTPDSKEWRDSLFAFGELLHVEGRYAEAARRLEEFVHRYPDAAQGLTAHYLIADSYRQGGQALQDGASAARGAAAVRRAAQAVQLREKALAEYEGVLASLGSRDDRDLTCLERAVLRNSQFAVGGLDVDLQEYEAAVRACTAATIRFSDTPEALEAYVRLAESFRPAGRARQGPQRAGAAKVALARLPKDTRFDQTTNYDRQQWGETLAWLSSL